MASTTPTPIATATTITSSFLRLAPELRNRIYKYAFDNIEKTTPLPHALTRTNKQIRNECRAMYYASIECIEITLRTFVQYNCTKRWLAYEDWSMFPVLPDITLLSYNVERRRDITIPCRREKIVPSNELPVQLAQLQDWYVTQVGRLPTATTYTYTKCLGLELKEFGLKVGAPSTFTAVIRGGSTWNIRRLGFCTENAQLLGRFIKLAEKKQGSEWTKDDLEAILEWFRLAVRYRERRKRVE